MIPAVMMLWTLGLVVIAVRWPIYLAHSAVICSVFEGAAVVNAGGVGISPYYFTLMLIACRCALVRVDRENVFGHSPDVRRIMRCAALLLAIGVGTAFVLPRVFAGWQVLSPRLSADDKAPLVFSTSNVGQSVYLLLNVMFLWYTAQTCRTPAAAQGLVKAFVISGLIVLALAGYQLLSSLTGLPFPDELLYSNQAYVIQAGTQILGMPRICSSFTEPAALAGFLIPFTLYLTGVLKASPTRGRHIALLLCAIACCLISTSSTAYLGLTGVFAYAAWQYILLPIVNGRGSVKTAVAVTLMIVATASTILANESLRDVIRKMIFEKSESSSYEERGAADTFSMQLAEQSWGLGVGLGSNRGSAFVPSMLSQVGVSGTAVIAALIYLFLRASDAATIELRNLHLPLGLALVGAFAVQAIGGPDLSSPSLWVIMAMMVAVSATAARHRSDGAGVQPGVGVPRATADATGTRAMAARGLG